MNFFWKSANPIRKAYELLFFLLYNHYKFEKDKHGKAYFVTFLITAFESFNIYSIVIFFKIKFNTGFDSKLISLIIFIFVAIFNVYKFAYMDKFLATNKIFADINYNRHHVTLFLWLYYLLSIIAVSYIILLDSVNGRFDVIENYFRNLGF